MLVRGSTIVTFSDHLRARWTRTTKITLALLVVVVIAITISNSHRPAGTALELAIYALSLVATTMAIGMIWFVAIIIGVVSFSRRLNEKQRAVIYEFDDIGHTVRDGTGASVSIPWAVISGARETVRAIRLEIRPTASRYVPKRAFSADDLTTLRALLSEKLGKADKLKT